jgi:hypothetical protein
MRGPLKIGFSRCRTALPILRIAHPLEGWLQASAGDKLRRPCRSSGAYGLALPTLEAAAEECLVCSVAVPNHPPVRFILVSAAHNALLKSSRDYLR